ncbi:MAG TPA: M23 family metallopeptidase [bacterium]|nr:M23 family metallopeptidase [bacterium]
MRSRFYTVMIIPDARSHVRTVLLRRGWILLVLACLLAAIAGVGLLVRAQLIARERIAQVEAQVARLRSEGVSTRQMAQLLGDVDRMKMRVSRVDTKAAQIETMIGLDGELAVGGPDSGRHSDAFSRYYNGKQKELLGEISDELGMLEANLDRQSARADLLMSYLNEHKKLLASIPSITPIDGGWLSSGYGYRRDPFTHRKAFHHGVDIACPVGTPVCITADGVVARVRWYSDWGYAVEVDHGNGFSTWYAHCSKLTRERGDRLERGDVIAQVGSTGRSTGPHLHYEVRINGKAQNPIYYMLDRR